MRGGYTGLGLVIVLITITLLALHNPTNTAQDVTTIDHNLIMALSEVVGVYYLI